MGSDHADRLDGAGDGFHPLCARTARRLHGGYLQGLGHDVVLHTVQCDVAAGLGYGGLVVRVVEKAIVSQRSYKRDEEDYILITDN